MFSKELENLIQATLEDGMLEEYEKAALVKRAQAEGVDLTELEIYINAQLQRRKRELKEKNEALDAQSEKEKKEAIGPVCPKCGKQVPPLTLKCECGYEFVKVNKESSFSLLMNKIDNLNKEVEETLKKSEDDIRRKVEKECDNIGQQQWKIESLLSYERDRLEKEKKRKILETVSSFIVPNTKEDIVEFLSASVPKAKLAKKNRFTTDQAGCLPWCVGIISVIICYFIFGWIGVLVGVVLGYLSHIIFHKLSYDPDSNEFKEAQVWKDKFDEVMLKGRSLRGDPEFTKQLDYYENMLNNK